MQLWGCTLMGRSNQTNDYPVYNPQNINDIPNATFKPEPLCKYGNPECYSVDGKQYHVMKSAEGYSKTGYASWYGTKFHGKKTSSREPYDMYAMTAASRNLPIPTYVEVTNLENGKKIIVKVNDRGPFKSDRIIDLSYAAAAKLGFASRGTAMVEVKAINAPTMTIDQLPTPVLIASQDNTADFIQINTSKLLENKENHASVKLSRYLQIGAFSNHDNAINLKSQILKFTHEPIRINMAKSQQKIIYRVQIGPFNNSDESDKILNQLHTHGFEKIITVFS